MATITKRGDHQWQAKIRRKGYPTVSQTFETKRDAEDWAKAVEGGMVTQTFVDNRQAGKTTLHEVLADYLAVVVPQRKGHQLAYMVRDWMARDLARRAIGAIRVADVKAWLRERLQDDVWISRRDEKGGVVRGPDGVAELVPVRKIGGKTVKNELLVLSAVYTHARTSMGMEGLPNPVELIPRDEMPKYKPRKRRITLAEYDRLMDACRADENPWIAPVFEFAVETAMRRAEIAGLRWADVHLDEGWCKLRDTKNGSDRDVGLSPRALEILRGVPRDDNPRVFPVTPDVITNGFGRAKARAGIGGRSDLDGMTFHDARHEATTRLFDKGLNIVEVAEQTGHKTLQMLTIYTHPQAVDIAKKLADAEK